MESPECASERERRNRVSLSLSHLRSSRSGRGLLAQDWLAHDGVLAGHPSAQCALHLGSESQLVQVVGLLCSGHKALGLQGLVLQALQAITEVSDVGDSGISAGQTADGALGVGKRGAATNRREALRVAVLKRIQSVL
jgi:hypothetical protein